MSAVEGLPEPLTPPGTKVELDTSALPVLCPYLATPDGGWRSATAVRDHRCMAVAPPVQLALEKQRRLCLTAAHTGCATFGAAQAASSHEARPRPPARPIARMTPVILDHGRFDLRFPALHVARGSGQAALVAVLGLALVAVLVARPSSGGGVVASGSASPAASEPVPTEIAAASSSAGPSVAVSSDRPTSSPTATPEPPDATSSPVSSAEPSTSGATYKVKSGDTLSAIAARFDTTVRVLVDLNGIADPSRLRVGQVLKLP